jgi:hypothetical protein
MILVNNLVICLKSFFSKNVAKIANSLPNCKKTDKKTKKSLFLAGFSLLLMQFHFFQLVFNDCFVGASAGASAATNAGVRVDDIDVAFRNSAHRAFVDTCAASNAGISDFVSHNVQFLS